MHNTKEVGSQNVVFAIKCGEIENIFWLKWQQF